MQVEMWDGGWRYDEIAGRRYRWREQQHCTDPDCRKVQAEYERNGVWRTVRNWSRRDELKARAAV